MTCRKHVINSNFNNLGLYAYLTNVFPCISHEKSNSFSHHWNKMCQFIIVVVFQMCSFRSTCICRSDAGWAGFFYFYLPQWFPVKSTCSVPKDLIAKKRNKRNIRDQMLTLSIRVFRFSLKVLQKEHHLPLFQKCFTRSCTSSKKKITLRRTY